MNAIPLNTKYTRVLGCDLKTKERAIKGEELNNELAKIDMLEAEAKEKADQYKALITQQKKRIKEIRRQMDTGQVERDVDVMDIPNVKAGTIETHRLDVSKSHPNRIVETRSMDLFEKSETSQENQADGEAMAYAEESGKKRQRKAKDKPAAKVIAKAGERKKSKLRAVPAQAEAEPAPDESLNGETAIEDAYPRAVNQ